MKRMSLQHYLRVIILLTVAFASHRVAGQAITINTNDLTAGLAASPLLGGSTTQAIFGFQLDKAAGGTNTVTKIIVSVNNDPTTSLVSANLHRSMNNMWDGPEPVISNGVLNGAAGTPPNAIVFDPILPATDLETFGGNASAQTAYFFVVVTVRSDVSTTPGTPAITLSLDDVDVTATGAVSGSTTGNPYSFTALNAPIVQQTGGVSTTVVAADLNKAIIGFSATTNGTQSLDDLVFTLDIDPSAGPLSGFQLINNGASSTYTGSGSVIGTVPSLTTSTVTFSNINQALTASPTYFFLIADVSAAATAGTFTTTFTSATTNTGGTSGTGFSQGPTNITTLTAALGQLTLGVAPSPLAAGSTGQAVLGFSLASNGNQTVSLIRVQVSSDPAGKLSNYALVASVDNSFSTTGDNATVVTSANIAVTGSGPYFIDITPVSPLNLSPSSPTNFFLTATVNGGVTTATPAIQPSLSTANITLNPATIPANSITGTNYTFSAAQTSTITVNYVGQNTIDFLEYSGNTVGTGLTTLNSLRIFAIDITDADGDSQPTTINNLVLELGDPANLNAIALFDAGTSIKVPGTELNVGLNIDGNNRITFSGLNIVVPDGSTGTPSVVTLDVRVTFNGSVTDNDVVSVLVYAAAASGSGSGLAPLGTVATGAANNDIDVVSTKLIFNTLPTTTTPATTFTAIVHATDANNNIDVNATDQVNITESGPGPGNISGGGNISPVNGVYTYNSLSINLAGTYNLTADDAGGGQTLIAALGVITINSLGVNITDGVGSSPLTLAVCYGGNFQALGTIKITETDPADFTSGGIFMLRLPNGFIFDTSVNPVLSETGNEITFNSLPSYFVGNNVVRISYNVSGTSDAVMDAITISGLMVKYPLTTPSTGNILVVDASAVQVNNAEADAQNHGTLAATGAASTGFSFEVAQFPGQSPIQPEETKFSYTTFGVLLKPAASNPPTTGDLFTGNGVSFSPTQNSYVFSPAAVGVGNNYDVTYTALNASGCLVSVTKTFQVYATAINGLLQEYCINDNTTQSLSVDPSRYDIAPYYADWSPIIIYNQYRRVKYNNEAYESLVNGNFAINPTNTSYWKKVGYTFTGDYSIYIPSYKNISSVNNNGAGTVIITSPNHGFVNGAALYLDYYVYDAFWNTIFYIPYASYTIFGVTTNTFSISYNHPATGLYTNGYGYTYIQNPTISGVSVVGNNVTMTVPRHGLSNGARIQIYLEGLSNNGGVSTIMYDWFTVSNVSTNAFTITSPTPVSGAWTGYGFVDIFNYRISTFTPSMVSSLNTNFGTITQIYVGFIVNQIGCTVNTYNTCAPFTYTNEPVRLNQLADLDFTGLNVTGSYCANATAITLTGNQTDGNFTGNGITDGGANNNTASFNPASGSITQGVPFNITYTFTDNKNCVASTFKTVVVNTTPPPPTPTQIEFGYCEGDTQPLILKVSGAGSDFAWYNNASKTTLLGIGPVYDASSVGTGSPITQPFFATQFNLGCESSTAQVDLVINPLPDADFTSVGQCAQDTVQFTGPAVDIATWNWDFGDGITSTAQDPMHIFLDSRTYSVNLDVASIPLAGGAVCRNSKTTNMFIGFNPDIKIAFNRLCDGDNTMFAHLSTPVLDSIGWDFGDGVIIWGKSSSTITGQPTTTGTFASPVHHYATYGLYPTTVIGKTSIGCSDTLTRNVPILIKLSPTPGSPYLMESANPNGESGYWQIETTVDSTSTWAFDVAQGVVLNTPDSVWITNPTGNYKSNDVSFVNSPCFDLTAFNRPLINFQFMIDTQTGRDGAILEYSTNSGLNWTRLGNPNTGLEWYNLNPVNALGNVFGWTESNSNTFRQAFHSLSNIPAAQRSNVRFRIKFASDQDTEGEGFAFKEVHIVEKNRQVLVENFTNTSAPGAVNHNVAFKNLPSYISPSEYVPLEYHIIPGGFGDDPINAQNQPDNNARAAFYGITQNITGTQDGLLMGHFNTAPASSVLNPDFEDEFNLRSLRSSPVDLTINTSLTTSQQLQIDVTVTALQDIATTNPIMVYIALVEKVVTDPALAGQNGETTFHYVLRKMLPNAAGTRMTLPMNINDTFTFTETLDVPDNWFSDINEMAVVAFVQNQVTLNGRKDVWQSAIELNPILPLLVTAIEPKFLEQIEVYPNPADGFMNVRLPKRASQNSPITLTDGMGRVVYSNAFSAGEQSKTLGVKELSGGIYVLHIELAKGVTAVRKVMITHRQ